MDNGTSTSGFETSIRQFEIDGDLPWPGARRRFSPANDLSIIRNSRRSCRVRLRTQGCGLLSLRQMGGPYNPQQGQRGQYTPEQNHLSPPRSLQGESANRSDTNRAIEAIQGSEYLRQ